MGKGKFAGIVCVCWFRKEYGRGVYSLEAGGDFSPRSQILSGLFEFR